MKGFSLTEVLIAIIILAIMASIAAVNYTKSRQNILDEEAKNNLKLIRSAELIYKIDHGQFVSCANISEINANLNLNIGKSGFWNYNVVVNGNNFNCTAVRNDNSRTCVLDKTQDEPNCFSK